MTKISTFSDQPFSFSPWNCIFGVKNHNCFEPGQNIGSFASPTKGVNTFLFEISMKWMFTLKNFRNVYWHGKQHSAMLHFSVMQVEYQQCNYILSSVKNQTKCSLVWRKKLYFVRRKFHTKPSLSSRHNGPADTKSTKFCYQLALFAKVSNFKSPTLTAPADLRMWSLKSQAFGPRSAMLF